MEENKIDTIQKEIIGIDVGTATLIEKEVETKKEQTYAKEEKRKEDEKKEESKEVTKIFNKLLGVEVFRTGTWKGDKYSTSDLTDMVNNFNLLKSRLRPRLKLGHNNEQELLKEDGMPAAGYVTNLYMKDNILHADFDNIPDKIFELIKSKQYNDVSVEINWNLKDENTGETFKRVLSAVALLGEEHPAVWENQPLDMFLPGELKAASQEKLDTKHYLYSKTTLKEEQMKEVEMALEALKKENEELKKINDELEVEKKKAYDAKVEKEVDDTLDKYLKEGKIAPAQKQYLKTILVELKEQKKEYTLGEKKHDPISLIEGFLSFSKPIVSLQESSMANVEEKSIVVRAKEYAKEKGITFEKALLYVDSQMKK